MEKKGEGQWSLTVRGFGGAAGAVHHVDDVVAGRQLM